MYCPCEECGDFTVPPLIMPCNSAKGFCQVEPYCSPCMPTCVKVPVVYCCERPKPNLPPRDECQLCCVASAHHPCERRQCDHCDCDCSRCRYYNPPCCVPPPCPKRKNHSPQRHSSHHDCSHCCDEYCPPCKPVRTKYVIPCYRYEDGRIVSCFTFLL